MDMSLKLVTYSFVPRENEQIDAVITVPDDPRSMIYGTVIDCKGTPVRDAVVKLLSAKGPSGDGELKPITHAFTDDQGHFLFGPLQPGRKYVIKVWSNDVKKRVLELREDEHESDCVDAVSQYRVQPDEGCSEIN